ncbi:hypothetical protein Nepgr_000992 [Nepenthes gracilis]|uniref:PGG domain-containing protein n=1 Tax=Nepenthes gracilis TaxID=150966 RepID=A0AAD3P694_NEPGR|nr:hypothetical protein Nepgr_000992 [Nepenthes gracilis]
MDNRERRLYDAALEGDVDLLLELLREDPLILHRYEVSEANSVGSPLHVVAKLGHVRFATEILNRKPELAEELDSRKSSPLHLASGKGHLEIVKSLLLVSPEMCLARDIDGRNPLHIATVKGQHRVLDEMVRTVPRAARERVSLAGDTVLHLCVKYKRPEALKLLLDSCVGDNEMLNAKDGDGNSILHLAVADKQLEVIKHLLKNDKINKNAKNTNGYTAMDIFSHCPSDVNKDRDIRNALRRAKVQRATYLDDRNTWKKHAEWLETQRSGLMIVASLIATMAFQTGLSPPGGVWQDATHGNGTSVLAQTMKFEYNSYFILTTVGLVLSMSTILLLISGLPCKRVSVGFMMVFMWIAITAITAAYLISVYVLTPNADRTIAKGIVLFSTLIWFVLVIVLLLGHIIRGFIEMIKWVYRCIKNCIMGVVQRA